MLTVEEALRLVEQHAVCLAAQPVPFGQAAGLVLAQDVVSDIDSPPHNKSMMDGYAVVSHDQSEVRHVIEEIAAGDVPRQAVTLGNASRIMTGAPLPDGADCVVPVEQSESVGGNLVRFGMVELRAGQNVLPKGTSAKVGDVVLSEETRLRPIDIAILAEVGCSTVNAIPRPRVAVLATGNELVPVDERPASGQIRNSNGPLIVAAAQAAGAEAIDLGIARDNHASLREHMRSGLTADVLVLSGGVSAGKYDLVPQVLTELGVVQIFHKVSLRPGKPLWFGLREEGNRRTLVFGLPGNPVSSFVCFELFARPAIAALSGRGFVGLTVVHAKLNHDYDHSGGRAACVPAIVKPAEMALATDPLPHLDILSWHGSADLATLARANALACLPAESRRFQAGDGLDAYLI
jgi:molybdopterin molybdotransferase